MSTKKKNTETPVPAVAAMVTVEVGAQAIHEGEHRPAGSRFETTAIRAAALGHLVKIVS